MLPGLFGYRLLRLLPVQLHDQFGHQQRAGLDTLPHPSPLTAHRSPLTPHPSPLTPHLSSFTLHLHPSPSPLTLTLTLTAQAANQGATGAAAATADGGNTKSNFAFLSSLLPRSITPTYIQSQWSFAQFRLPGSEKSPTRSIAAFGGAERETFLVVCADGTFFKCHFDPVRGGECTSEVRQQFLSGEEDE